MRNRGSHRIKVVDGGTQRHLCVPVLGPPQPHTDFQHSCRDVAGDKCVSASMRNLLRSEGVRARKGVDPGSESPKVLRCDPPCKGPDCNTVPSYYPQVTLAGRPVACRRHTWLAVTETFSPPWRTTCPKSWVWSRCFLVPRSLLLGLANLGAHDRTPNVSLGQVWWTASDVGLCWYSSRLARHEPWVSLAGADCWVGRRGWRGPGGGACTPALKVPWLRPAPPSLRLIGSRVWGCQGDGSPSCDSARTPASRLA